MTPANALEARPLKDIAEKRKFNKSINSYRNDLQCLLNIKHASYQQIIRGLRDPEIPKLAKFNASVLLFKAFVPRNLQIQQTNTNVNLNELINQIKANPIDITKLSIKPEISTDSAISSNDVISNKLCSK